jgi:large repetitive protein
MRTLTTSLAVTLLSLALASGAHAAKGASVSCGDRITSDTTLESDLVDCRNNGIAIAADDVTLDLNGHRIDGDGRPFAACPRDRICDAGILTVGHDGVTVKHGSVREFDVGALVGNGSHNRVLGVSSTRNASFGFVIFDSARSLVRNSSGSNNLAPEGDGMGLFGSHHVRILHSSFRHNPEPGIVVDESSHNLIAENLFSQTGILIRASNGNQVRRNRSVRDAEITVESGNRNVIAGNRISDGFAGIGIEQGRGNVVARNVVIDPHRVGIYLGLPSPPIGGANNVVRRNRVRGSDVDGFVVNEEDGHSVLRRNVAIDAGDDGFDIASRSTKLTGNRALRNADLGIEAVRGVIDGGGNVARDNGDPRQCTHISCR